jgi:GGDEF domain-containing protein
MAILESIIESIPSSVFVIDDGGEIQYLNISKHTNISVHLRYKNFWRVLRLIFEPTALENIRSSYDMCIKNHEIVEIMRCQHSNIHGLNEYFFWKFSPIANSNNVVIYVQNITESILLEEEFTSVTKQYESVNRELCVAVSNLDFHLMDLEQMHKRLGALYRITSVVQKITDEHELLEEIINGITRELGFFNVAIFLLDKEQKELVIQAQRGYADDIRIPINQGIIGQAATKRELVYISNIDNEPGYLKKDIVHDLSEIALPLIVDDKVIGVLDMETSKDRVMQDYDLDFLRSLASQIAITIAHVKHVASVEVLAITDGLTGLYNYRYFRKLLDIEFKRALRYKRPLSQLMIDIDYFKNYNDTYGHLMGDEILQRVASLIKENCRDIDFVVRYGGE